MSQFSALYGILLDRELGTDDTTLFTTVRRKAAVNDATVEFARQTKCYVRTATIALSDGTSEYDLEAGITAGDFVELAKEQPRIEWTDTGGTVTTIAGDEFKRSDVSVLNRTDPGWQDAADATPSKWYLRDDGGKVYFGLYPPPEVAAGETWNLKVPYVAVPPTMTLDTHEPFEEVADIKISLREWHQGIVHFAASFLEKFRRDKVASLEQKQLALEYVADYLKSRRPKSRQVQFARNYRGERS